MYDACSPDAQEYLHTVDDESCIDYSVEADLIARAKEADPDAISDLYAMHFPEVRKQVASKVGETSADDIAQEAMIKVLCRPNLAGFEDNGNGMGGYFNRVAGNTVIDHIRAQKRRPTLSLDQQDGIWPLIDRGIASHEDITEQVVALESLRSIYDYVSRKMSPEHAAILIKAALGYPYEDIAQEYGFKRLTINSRINKIRNALFEAAQMGEIVVPEGTTFGLKAAS